jgi:DNA invertase Pin-like site-specific DNA recombinase
MRVVGYARVSTSEQAKDGVSLDAQVEKIGLFAKLHGLTLAEVVVDPGESAKSLDRPGLGRVLAMLAVGEVAGVVVAKLDRLTRTVADLARLLDDHFGDRGGKQLFSVADSIDTRTAAGRLVLNVLMSVSQWEREIIAERTADALDHKRGKGERIGHVPFGWRLLDDGRSLAPDPAEQEARALILTWRREHKTLRWIGAELVRRGFAPRSGSPTWSPSVIRHIALNTIAADSSAA